jgi:hypothetical protein
MRGSYHACASGAEDIGNTRGLAGLPFSSALVSALHYLRRMLQTIVIFTIWLSILVYVAARLSRPA